MNRDGFRDVEFRFRTRDVGLLPGENVVPLLGETFDGKMVRGYDSVVVVFDDDDEGGDDDDEGGDDDDD